MMMLSAQCGHPEAVDASHYNDVGTLTLCAIEIYAQALLDF